MEWFENYDMSGRYSCLLSVLLLTHFLLVLQVSIEAEATSQLVSQDVTLRGL